MKNRLISLLLCLVLCVGLLPMAALAENIEPLAVEDGEAMPEPTAEPEPTVEPEVTAEPTATPEVTAEPAEESEPEPDPAAQVQALLDALPDAEAVTAETRAAVEAQLTAIDDARLALDDDSMLDYTRYAAIVAALEALDGTPGASEPETLAGEIELEQSNVTDGTLTLEGGKSYKLTGDISISKTIQIQAVANVVLDLNGQTLTMNADKDIFSLSGGSLTLKDSGTGGKITFQSGKSGRGVVINSTSKFTMQGGTITGCTSKGDHQAGGVYVAAGGTFDMSGGTISNCRADTANNYAAQYAAGGVYVAASGTFAMSGGTISGCTANAKYGAGGVYAGGTFTMSGDNAKIENCVDNAWESAGGVYMPSGGVFDMQKGTITGCKTMGERCAGGVCMSGGSTFTMSGGTIKLCTAGGTETSASNSNFRAGGVYMSGNSKFTMSGGEISYCSTSVNYSAGGVYVDTNSTFDMTGGTVNVCQVVFTESQKAQNVAGGVYNTGTFSIKGTNGQKKASLLASCVQTKFLDDKNLSSELSDPNERRLVAGNVVNTNNLTMGEYSGITAGYVQCDDQAGGEALSLDIYNTKKLTADGGMAGSIYQKSGATLTKSAGAGYTTEFSNGGVNCGVIRAGKFTDGTLTNHGTINAGEFAAEQLYNYGTISAGKFTGGTLSNHGTIENGVFTENVKGIYNHRTITDGTFNCDVWIDSYTTTIDGSEVIKGGTISGGTFTGIVQIDKWHYDKLSVTGGDFSKADRRQTVPIGIIFDLNGASGTAPATQWRWNAKAARPEDPTRDGYHFCGWYEKEADGQLKDTRWDFERLLDLDFAGEDIITLYAKWEALFATAPKAKTSLTYNGVEQELITQGTLSSYAKKNDYTLEYKLSTDNAYSATVPTGRDAGNYTVNYRVMEDGTVETSGSVNVTIEPKTVTELIVALGMYTYNGQEHTPGVTVMDGSQVVSESAYTVSYSNNINAGTATVTVTDNADDNYNVTASSSFTIERKIVTVSGITAEDKIYDGKATAELNCDNVTFDGKLDDDDLSVRAMGMFADKNVGNGKTVKITVLALDGEDRGNYALAQNGHQTSATADITKRPVTLESASESKAYDGTALKAETVTATGMVDGEVFDYDFTGSQTDIGASENKFTAKNSDTAKVANYNITYDYGTLRVTVPADIGDGTEDMTVDTVTSDDREVIEDTLKTVEDYLDMEPTKDEATELNELKNKLEDLLEKLDDAKAASEDKTITDTDGIDKDNAKSSDKQKLEDAKDAIEKVLEDYETNLTEEEKQELNDKLDRIEDALERLDEAKAASEDKTITDADDIDKDNAKSSDKQKLEDAKDAIEKALEDYDTNLTEEEKQELNDKLDRIEDALERLDEAKAASEDKTITKTDKIDKDNAKPSDKQKLEDAKDAIEKALEDYDTNLTDEEKQELNDKLDRINAALDAIAAAEAAAKAARTGDEAMPMLWLALALSAALALGYTARKKKN